MKHLLSMSPAAFPVSYTDVTFVMKLDYFSLIHLTAHCLQNLLLSPLLLIFSVPVPMNNSVWQHSCVSDSECCAVAGSAMRPQVIP